MGNIFKNPEQRAKWNAYNGKYNKARYRTFSVKLPRKECAREIEYLENSPLGASAEIRKMLKEKISGENK